MKHIDSINEFYHRTAGFRYSKPDIGFTITCYYIGSISEAKVKEILEDLDVEYTTVLVERHQEIITVTDPEDSEKEEDIEVDGEIKVDILIYNEREMEKILDDFTKSLHIDYDVDITDLAIKEHSKKNKI